MLPEISLPEPNSPDTFRTPPAAAPLIEETWGTSQRMEHEQSHADQAGVDEMLDRATRMNSGPKFMTGFHPQARWLWKQWHGTVVERTAPSAVYSMIASTSLLVLMETARQDGTHTWSFLEVPDHADKWVARLKGFTTMWGYLLTMATFVTTFFLSQAYGYWLATKGNVRKVQGRLSDMGMLIATHAQRDAATGRFSEAAEVLCTRVARWMRLYHMLFWAGQVRPARGDHAVSYSLLRTERGLRGLVERGVLTRREFALLIDLPETGR